MSDQQGSPVMLDAVSTSLRALHEAMDELTSCTQAHASAPRLSAAAREVELRARGLAALLEDRTPTMPARVEPLLPPQLHASDRFRVLVVDDRSEELDALTRVLGTYFEVIVARDATQAAELLREHPADVVLTDLYRPATSAMALPELSKSVDHAHHIPLLVISGRTDTDAKVQAFESGAFDFISKPVPPAELVARVRNALAHSQVLRRERVLGGRDDLTGLSNRRTFRRFLEGAVETGHAQTTPVALVLVDQDRLKHINDTFGHPTGDEALRILAHALASSTRGTDCTARVGGDEFALVIPGCDRDGARRLLSRVDEALRRTPLALPGGRELIVEASCGVACLGEVSLNESVEDLVRRADKDLYDNKRRRQAAMQALTRGASASAAQLGER